MKKVMKAVGLIVVLLVIYFLAQSVVTLVLGIIHGIQMAVAAAASNTPLDIKSITSDLLRYIGTQTPWVLIVAVAITVPTYFLIYRGRKPELLKFVSLKGIHPISVPVLVIFGLALNIVMEMLLSLLNQLSFLKSFFDSYNQVSNLIFGGGFALSLLAVGVLGPMFEEILFRGLVFGELRKITKVRTAIFIQALIFGIYHMNVVQGSYAFVIGIMLGFIYYRSNSIYASMIVHITINSSSVLIGKFISGDSFGKWSTAIVSASVLLFLVCGYFILTHRSFRHAMDESLYDSNHTPKPGPA